MGCDDVPDSLFPKFVREPTMHDIERLQARVDELERLVARIYEASRTGPVRLMLAREISPGHINMEVL